MPGWNADKWERYTVRDMTKKLAAQDSNKH